jgi:hypothetical protein
LGYSLSWFAVRGKEPEMVLAELGLALTGEREDVPEAPLTSVRLKSHWFVVIINEVNSQLISRATSQVSQAAELLTCHVEEHVMQSGCAYWEEGQKVWSVEHDAQIDPTHLTISGNPPTELDEIRRRLVNEPGVDRVFDVPVEIAKLVTGFRHDENITNGEAFPFEVLTKPGGESSWLGRLFKK